MTRPSHAFATATRGLLRAAVIGAVVALLASCADLGGSATAPKQPMSPAPLPGKFVWRNLVTEDPDAVKPFYAALFGWQFVEATSMGAPYSFVKSGGEVIGGISRNRRTVPDQPVSQWIAFLSVPSVDRAVDSVRREGGSVVAGPVDLPKVGRGAVVLDPEGAPLGLLRQTAGDPADPAEPPINGFLWAEHLSRKPGEAADFYARLAGAEVRKTDFAGTTYWVLWNGRPRAGLLRNPIKHDRPVWLNYVRVADPAATAARAVQLGGRVLLAPHPDVRGGTLALIADPAGAVLALQKWPLRQ